MVKIEIIVVGNEILLGLVRDTNSNYLCRVISGLGGRVRRIATVRDVIDAIVEEIKAAVGRNTELIFTCGGLGPTEDDLTLAAVARAANAKLLVDDRARSFVERRFRELAQKGFVENEQMTGSRLKMATLPEGSEILENLVGTAPGVVFKLDRSHIVSLPGVPAELKSIVEGPLQNLLSQLLGRGSYREREMLLECGDESLLTSALSQASAANPEVYIKSRAALYGADVKTRIALAASADKPEDAEALLERASRDLRQALKEIGIRESKGN